MSAYGSQSRVQQKYKIQSNPAEKLGDFGAVEESPLAGKSGTMGSLGQRVSWKTPEGAAYSSQTRTSTLFDQPSSPAQIPQMSGDS